LALPGGSAVRQEVERQVGGGRRPRRSRPARRRRGGGGGSRRGRDARGRFLSSGRRKRRRYRGSPTRGIKTLRRARHSVRWQRGHGVPRARGYVSRHFARVNPGGPPLKTWEEIAGTLGGYLGSRL